jgi:hypothetical protein
MPGKWIETIPYSRCREYSCAKPQASKRECGVGSIWECECGQRWVITKWNSDQRDGDYPSWNKVAQPLPR